MLAAEAGAEAASPTDEPVVDGIVEVEPAEGVPAVDPPLPDMPPLVVPPPVLPPVLEPPLVAPEVEPLPEASPD